MSDFETLTAESSDGIIDIELNRPNQLNAISSQMAAELSAATSEFASKDDARVLIIRGAGRAFSAGADVGGAADQATATVPRQLAEHSDMQEAIAAIEKLPVVKIAEVHGHCVGAGLVLASMCEIRIASTDAKFSIPELAFGIPFSMGGLPRIARYFGLTRTADMVLTGRRVPADEARDAGFITRVVEPDQLRHSVVETATELAQHPKLLILETIERLRDAGESLLDTGRSDLSSLVLATLDPESRKVMDEYTKRITSK